MAPAVGGLSEDHAAVYDRQLRVWGVEVQRRLMEAKVLIVGLGGLAAEIAKNIVLAGVGTVALRDDTPAAHAAPGNFLVDAEARASSSGSVAEACARTLQAMNPLMSVTSVPGPPRGLTASDVAPYDTVVACGMGLAEAVRLDELVRGAGAGKHLFACAVVGASSYVMVDLQQHTYSVKGEQGERQLAYPSLREVLAADLAAVTRRTHPLYLVLRACAEFEQRHGRPAAGPADVAAVESVASELVARTGLAAAGLAGALPDGLLQAFVLDQPGAQGGGEGQGGEQGQGEAASMPEFPPVCAAVGGVVANNVLRAVSGVGTPLCNLFLYSLMAKDGMGVEERLPKAAPPPAAK